MVTTRSWSKWEDSSENLKCTSGLMAREGQLIDHRVKGNGDLEGPYQESRLNSRVTNSDADKQAESRQEQVLIGQLQAQPGLDLQGPKLMPHHFTLTGNNSKSQTSIVK